MKKYIFYTIALFLTALSFVTCKKNDTSFNPRLLITLRNDTGGIVSGATVRLYKNVFDAGITKISDSTGIVIFNDLEEELYYWLAEKGCQTNRNSQTTLNRILIPDVILYGYSVLSETGTLIITNHSPEPYKVSDSLFNITLNSDTPFITYPKVSSYTIHSEKVSTPGVGKDTLVHITCADTVRINLPY